MQLEVPTEVLCDIALAHVWCGETEKFKEFYDAAYARVKRSKGACLLH
jgi:hypothetical protein